MRQERVDVARRRLRSYLQQIEGQVDGGPLSAAWADLTELENALDAQRGEVVLTTAEADQVRIWVERGKEWIYEFAASNSWEYFEKDRQEVLGYLGPPDPLRMLEESR